MCGRCSSSSSSFPSVLSRGGTCCLPIAAIVCSFSCWNFVAVSLGIIWLCGCAGIKWMLVTIYDERFDGGTVASVSVPG